jgi:trk system potassium uptake protein TrkH
MGLVYGFAGLIAIGTFLLALPVSNTAGGFTPFMTALFTATSAATVTGHVVVDTALYWSLFGHAVILGLIFFGGLGLLSGAAFLLLVAGQRLGLQNLIALREGFGGGEVGTIRRLIVGFVPVVVFIEFLGAVLLFLRFYVFSELWEGISFWQAAWQSLFHAVSAFNNAGFDIFANDVVGGDSVIGLRHDYIVLGVMAGLIILGGLSYLVIFDVATHRRFSKFELNTKLVLVSSVVLIFLGAAVFLVQGWRDPGTLGAAPVSEKIAASLFDSVAARTAGFAAIDYGKATPDRQVAGEMLMFIGGASASTAGGIKVNTAMIIVLAVISTIRGRRQVMAFGREVAAVSIHRATVVLAAAVFILGLFTLALAATHPELPFQSLVFDLVSAFGTVGLSTGISFQLNPGGQFLFIAAMFIGKFGALTLALWMAGREAPQKFRLAEERVRIG